MFGRRILLLVSLLSAGVAIVWLFGVRDGESLLSGAKRASGTSRGGAADGLPSATDHPESSSTPPLARETSGDLALGNARIPIREPLADDPDVRVLKYLIVIDSSDGAVGRRVRAAGVRVEVYNKKPDQDSKIVAIISGKNAEMEFRDPPDPRSGFRDTVLLTMTLRDQTRIEYFDEAGGRIALLENDELHLDDDSITGGGPSRIELQGLVATGTGLRFDRHTSGLTLERDILIKGRDFALPSRRVTKPTSAPSKDAPEDAEEKTIACSGPFSFQPQEKPKTAPDAPQDDLSALVSGGVMTFLGNVVATQGERMRLDCEGLEIVLAEPKETEAPSEDQGAANLSVSRFFARGSNSNPCKLRDTMGTFIAETLLQEEKPDGTWITLNGSPKIENAGLDSAAADPAASGATRFDATASRQIRLRPTSPDSAAPDAAADVRRFLVEIDGDAMIATRGSKPEEEVRLTAAKIDMHVSSTSATETGKATSGLDRLVAKGAARGALSKGVFQGDEIVLIPSGESAAADAYRLEIRPNPNVQFALGEKDPGAAPQIATFDTPKGSFTWLPKSGDVPASGVFLGETTVDIRQGETPTLTMHATESIQIALAETNGKQGVSALDAKGGVTFDDRGSGASGSGNQMTLIPREDGSRRVRLIGSPAHAVLPNEDGSSREIAASRIEFDPSDGSLQARDSVNVMLTGLGLAAAAAKTPAVQSTPARLRCQELDVSKGADGLTKLSARRDVFVDDPSNGSTARGAFLDFSEGGSTIVLRGDETAKAAMTRHFGADASGAPNYVMITGPRLDLNSETKELSCPDSGEIELVRPLEANAASTNVRATAAGPIRYASNLLDLSSDVVIRFDEDGSEVRALWCDRAKVIFEDTGATEDGSKSPSGGFKELLAEGRVHLDQSIPKPMQAEGHRLRWLVVDGRQTLHLAGSSPRCWIRGLSENEHLRYEADSFVVVMGAQDFTAENGRLLYEPEPVLK